MQRFLPARGRRPLSLSPRALAAPQPPASLRHRRSSSCPHRSEHFLRGGPRDSPVSPEAPAASRKPQARRSAAAPSLLLRRGAPHGGAAPSASETSAALKTHGREPLMQSSYVPRGKIQDVNGGYLASRKPGRMNLLTEEMETRMWRPGRRPRCGRRGWGRRRKAH